MKRVLRLVAGALSDDRLSSCQNRAFFRNLAFSGNRVFNGDAVECAAFKSSLVKFTYTLVMFMSEWPIIFCSANAAPPLRTKPSAKLCLSAYGVILTPSSRE